MVCAKLTSIPAANVNAIDISQRAPLSIFTLRPFAEQSSGFSTVTTWLIPFGALGIVTVLADVVFGIATSTALTNLLTFLSNAGVDCAGVGGAPGESVYLKFGYGDKEPKQEGYYLNLDKGQQAESGSHAKVIGNVAAQGADCGGVKFAEKTIQSFL